MNTRKNRRIYLYMKYLKLFENFDQSEIDKICKKYNFQNYTINPDGSIDVDDNVWLGKEKLTKLPLKFNRVTGSFNCINNQLTTLDGAPKEVGGDFICYGNKLTDLKGGPKYIDGDYDCSYNYLTTLDGVAEYGVNEFECGMNPINDLYKFFPDLKTYLDLQDTYKFLRKDCKIVRHLLEEVFEEELGEDIPDEVFHTFNTKVKLIELGILSSSDLKTDFILKIRPEEIKNYVDVNTDLFEKIMDGEGWEYLEYDSYDGQWEYNLRSCLDNDNKKIIKDYLSKKDDLEEYDDLEDMVKELDDDYTIRNILTSTENDMLVDLAVDYYSKELKSTLEYYGEIIKFEYGSPIEIKVDITNFDGIMDNIEETIDYLGTEEVSEIFNHSLSEGIIDIPKIRIDDRWEPSVSWKDYNVNVKERLLDEL